MKKKIKGCDCPDGYYMDDSDPSNLECVPVNECKCYDMYTNRFYPPNTQLNKKCSNWYLTYRKIYADLYFKINTFKISVY